MITKENRTASSPITKDLGTVQEIETVLEGLGGNWKITQVEGNLGGFFYSIETKDYPLVMSVHKSKSGSSWVSGEIPEYTEFPSFSALLKKVASIRRKRSLQNYENFLRFKKMVGG
jgi:hypothetical protein